MNLPKNDIENLNHICAQNINVPQIVGVGDLDDPPCVAPTEYILKLGAIVSIFQKSPRMIDGIARIIFSYT